MSDLRRLLPTAPSWRSMCGIVLDVAAVCVLFVVVPSEWPEGPARTVVCSMIALAGAVLGGGLVSALARRRHALADSRLPSDAGHYRLLDRIAAGGMGEVWRARHASLHRLAAVKLISRRLLGKSEEEMVAIRRDFAREAQSTASLRSPHTVQLYDFGETEEGSLYYVMELLGGLDLATLVQRFGPQPPERVVHILSQVCQSLGEAHGKGLVHRDIKPGNLQLTAHAGEFDFVKVLDFGLAKSRNGERYSLDGMMRGTPGYMAPETIGHASTIDERADDYALGCVAYRLLTGRQVFDAPTLPALLHAHVSRPPIRPSSRVPGPIPAELDRLVLSLLAKDPSERPRDATEVLRKLREIPLATPWDATRAEAWWQENLPLEGAEPTNPNAPEAAAPESPESALEATIRDRPARPRLSLLSLPSLTASLR